MLFIICSLRFSEGTISTGNLCCNEIAFSRPACQLFANPFHADALKPSAFDGLSPVILMHIICAFVHTDL